MSQASRGYGPWHLLCFATFPFYERMQWIQWMQWIHWIVSGPSRVDANANANASAKETQRLPTLANLGRSGWMRRHVHPERSLWTRVLAILAKTKTTESKHCSRSRTKWG